MKRTRLHLLSRAIADRSSFSFDARGYLHNMFLEHCEAHLKEPLSQAVGWTLFRYVRIRRKHPAYQGRPLRRPSKSRATQERRASSEAECIGVSIFEIEIADADGTVLTRELTGEEWDAAYERWRRANSP